MRQDLENHSSQCKPCTEKKISKAQKPNEVDMSSFFEHFFPGSRVQIDYAFALCCQISGFIQVDKTNNNFVEECDKIGVCVEHSTVYNQSSQLGTPFMAQNGLKSEKRLKIDL